MFPVQLKSRVRRASHSVKCKLVYLPRSLLITLRGNPWGSQPISREITVRHTHDLHHGSVPFIKADVEMFPFSGKKKKKDSCSKDGTGGSTEPLAVMDHTMKNVPARLETTGL